MKAASRWLVLGVCGVFGALALAAVLRPGLAQSGQNDTPPTEPGLWARDPHAPLLLDSSYRVADLSRHPEWEDCIPYRPGMIRVAMDILVDGRPLPTLHHAGKTYLPIPRMGEEYQIRVWSHGPRRVAAVVSVDGLSVITGQPASENDPGYLVTPYGHVLIKGWRKNLDNMAAFRFVARDRSYAGLRGEPENIGVIGLVAFEERILCPLPRLERRDAAPASGKLRTEVGSIGTEYGREIDSRACYVPFVRSSHKQTITLYYDTVEALREAGVPVDRPSPDPFPCDLHFAPPPPAYQGK